MAVAIAGDETIIVLLHGPGDFWKRIGREEEVEHELQLRAAKARAELPDLNFSSHYMRRQFDQEVEAAAVEYERQRLDGVHHRRWSVCAEAHRKRQEKFAATVAPTQKKGCAKARRASANACLQLQLQYEAEVREVHREVGDSLKRHEQLVRYVHTGYLWRDHRMLTDTNRQLGAILADFTEHCSEVVDALWEKASAAEQLKVKEVKRRDAEITANVEHSRRLAVEALDAELDSRAVPLTLRFPVLPNQAGAPLPLVFRCCLTFLGCPAACSLAALAASVVVEASRLQVHCRRCPLAQHCNVCGFCVLPGPQQSACLEWHRGGCAPWLVDGRMLRQLFAGEPRLPAAYSAVAVQRALAAIDASDFVGVDRAAMAPEAPVCCPHLGCDAAFASREAALEHATTCERQVAPPWRVSELTARLMGRGANEGGDIFLHTPQLAAGVQ
eukprot:NODE_7583_length_1566_cov_5.337040.p2 GENE.NODE_7583_length_1566_cov_5.337040~~NODE_7583_length_1566_cov_5.337040.p2  ORF type:complete len:443 (+),score=112.38 NODE_7583_length_1566_cov_5.337040:61-1389(+)